MFRTLRPLILASESPRRKRLLQSIGLEFKVHPSNEEESGDSFACPADAAEEWATRKAVSVSRLFPDSWVLGADTVVVLDGRIFGKPADRSAARKMLESLSGRIHEVITGMCLANAEKDIRRTGAVITQVQFKGLAETEIEAYIRTGEPMDKAGAYGIQGIGAFLVKWISGSYSNVVGLPVCHVVDWLTAEGIIEPD